MTAESPRGDDDAGVRIAAESTPSSGMPQARRRSSHATLDRVSSRKSGETRAAVLDAARQLFEVGGYHAVGLEAVARKAGVSRVESVAAATWEPPRRRRYADCHRMAEWLEGDGVLADRVSTRSAADILFTLASIPAYESLVMIRGWSPRRWTNWTRQTLRTALLAPA
jgi:hypothetical protein